MWIALTAYGTEVQVNADQIAYLRSGLGATTMIHFIGDCEKYLTVTEDYERVKTLVQQMLGEDSPRTHETSCGDRH